MSFQDARLKYGKFPNYTNKAGVFNVSKDVFIVRIKQGRYYKTQAKFKTELEANNYYSVLIKQYA
tara:strand:+ start:351 stop:545 length:195 start_codon:yes stop_codon:yes gene_type:complete